MAQNKEQLDKLLGFISSIIKEPGNEEFTQKLKALVSPNGESNAFRYSQIERYLGLDFKLDEANTIADYSYVKDDFIRNQLVCDNREMLRYRFGVRSHKVDFNEFCRYAALQIEMLMYYYYNSQFETLDMIKNDICKYYSKANLDNYKSFEAIPFFAKTSSYCAKFGFKKKTIIDNIREIRNDQSHRSDQKTEEDFVSKMTKSLKMFPLYQNGKINFDKLSKDTEKYSIFKSMFEKDYYRYLYVLWKKQQPFDEIIETIQLLANDVKSHLLQIK